MLCVCVCVCVCVCQSSEDHHHDHAENKPLNPMRVCVRAVYCALACAGGRAPKPQKIKMPEANLKKATDSSAEKLCIIGQRER